MQRLTRIALNGSRNKLFNDNREPKFPIIQAPMAGGILSPEIVAKIANSGFFANIASGYLGVNTLQKFIDTTKKLLQNPQTSLGVNIFIDNKQQLYRDQSFTKTNTILEIEKLLNMDIANNSFNINIPQESEYVDTIIANSIPVASCTFGFFNGDSIEKLKRKGMKIIGNATNLQELSYCVQSGADAVVVQGTEGGGHQASFLTDEKNLIGTIQLLQQARQHYPKLTIIAAGGISPNNAYNYFQHGADYIQLGTAFMMTYESNVPDLAKQYITDHRNNTMLTKSITGKYARGISNDLIKKLEEANLHEANTVYPFPLGHYATAALRARAKELQQPEYMSLWAGSNPNNLELKPIDQVIDELQQIFY